MTEIASKLARESYDFRDVRDVLRRRDRRTRTGEAENAEKEKERERKTEETRKTKRNKRICDLAAPRTRPRLPVADFSHLSGFSVVVRR